MVGARKKLSMTGPREARQAGSCSLRYQAYYPLRSERVKCASSLDTTHTREWFAIMRHAWAMG
jgi:hypothetical protein